MIQDPTPIREQGRTPEDPRRVVHSLVEWLKAPEQAGLRRDFTTWLNRVLLPARIPGVEFPQATELQEVENMLEETVKDWVREWKQQGIELGEQKGMQKGEVHSAEAADTPALPQSAAVGGDAP